MKVLCVSFTHAKSSIRAKYGFTGSFCLAASQEILGARQTYIIHMCCKTSKEMLLVVHTPGPDLTLTSITIGHTIWTGCMVSKLMNGTEDLAQHKIVSSMSAKSHRHDTDSINKTRILTCGRTSCDTLCYLCWHTCTVRSPHGTHIQEQTG